MRVGASFRGLRLRGPEGIVDAEFFLRVRRPQSRLVCAGKLPMKLRIAWQEPDCRFQFLNCRGCVPDFEFDLAKVVVRLRIVCVEENCASQFLGRFLPISLEFKQFSKATVHFGDLRMRRFQSLETLFSRRNLADLHERFRVNILHLRDGCDSFSCPFECADATSVVVCHELAHGQRAANA